MASAKKLEKLQNKAARIITGSGWDARSAQILRALNWHRPECNSRHVFAMPSLSIARLARHHNMHVKYI